MNPLKILWAAPYCLHDTSNGAAMYMKAMLEKLAEQGFQVQVLASLTFDTPSGTSLFPNFDEQMKHHFTFMNIQDGNILYQYQKVKSLNVMEMTNNEEREFFAYYRNLLKDLKPDIVIQYGGSMLDMTIRAEAKRNNIATAFVICNGGYKGYNFPDTDIILNESPATAKWYKENSNLNLTVVGSFIYPEKVRAETHNPQYITFVNPCADKGVALFAALALACKKALPEAKFLVVNSRGDWITYLNQAGYNTEDFTNVDISPHVSDMRPIYAVTKILLAPSYWYENFCRCACEALLNHIPVLCTTSGGLTSTIGEGGIALPQPPQSHSNYLYIPTEEELQPWIQALDSMLNQYPLWQEKAKKAAEIHDINLNAQKTAEILKELVLYKKPLYDPHIYMR